MSFELRNKVLIRWSDIIVTLLKAEIACCYTLLKKRFSSLRQTS